MADLVGISPWEIRYRNAIRPGGVLPNGQIVDDSTGLVETLEAVKRRLLTRPNADTAGIACAMKNAGVGVGIPDWGRCKLIVEADEKVHIYSGASCIGQGLGTVLVQMVCANYWSCPGSNIVYERSNTMDRPGLRRHLRLPRRRWSPVRPARRACVELQAALAGKTLQRSGGEGLLRRSIWRRPTRWAPMCPTPSATSPTATPPRCACWTRRRARVAQMVAAHDVGKAVNPLSV